MGDATTYTIDELDNRSYKSKRNGQRSAVVYLNLRRRRRSDKSFRRLMDKEVQNQEQQPVS